MDWVPVRQYGEVIEVPPLTTLAFILYTPDVADNADGDVHQVEEGGSHFLERIVGTVSIFANLNSEDQTNHVPWCWRLMPLQYSTGNIAPDLPWDPSFQSMMLSPELANLRFWAERYGYAPTGAIAQTGFEPMVSLSQLGSGLTSYGGPAHPWWANVDVHPRQAFGQKRNLWPCFVVENNSALDILGFRLRLRMLVK